MSHKLNPNSYPRKGTIPKMAKYYTTSYLEAHKGAVEIFINQKGKIFPKTLRDIYLRAELDLDIFFVQF